MSRRECCIAQRIAVPRIARRYSHLCCSIRVDLRHPLFEIALLGFRRFRQRGNDVCEEFAGHGGLTFSRSPLCGVFPASALRATSIRPHLLVVLLAVGRYSAFFHVSGWPTRFSQAC